MGRLAEMQRKLLEVIVQPKLPYEPILTNLSRLLYHKTRFVRHPIARTAPLLDIGSRPPRIGSLWIYYASLGIFVIFAHGTGLFSTLTRAATPSSSATCNRFDDAMTLLSSSPLLGFVDPGHYSSTLQHLQRAKLLHLPLTIANDGPRGNGLDCCQLWLGRRTRLQEFPVRNMPAYSFHQYCKSFVPRL